MLKVGIVALLLILELSVYYNFGVSYSFFMQVAVVGYLFYWYYSERKPDFDISDKLLLISTLISLFSPLTVHIKDIFIGSSVKFILIALNYIIIILLFKLEGAKMNFSGKSKHFSVFVSYIITPFAFLSTVIFPAMNLQSMILSAVYIIPLVYMVLLSTFLPFSEKGKLYISIAMFLIMLSSGLSAYRLYVSSFPFDYFLLRTLITASRVFMLLGMLNRFGFRQRINLKR